LNITEQAEFISLILGEGPDPLAVERYLWHQHQLRWASSTGDPSRDAAVSAFATRIAPVDPQLALQWATTIAEPGARSSEIEAAIESWFEVDPAKAIAWLANSGLPDEIKVRFLPSQG
jgi:hypothetical protein